ncbi:DoxX family membrane protein [Streptomyces sp. JJ36]|uniref:DoxX family membrane protein n=1 Tax=Streptomyces sp. JJ36 TaxID=2736645 RepID=UPI001F20D9F0|nr:DoxX family membrane protein [Streptomyces sp. JJ36]MCF6523791.1 DoxX family membrane protein [Streptomyces sp. JJ36]
MSVDTRTPRTASGGTPRGFLDEEPVLSTVKVPCDPAQVVVNHASFRVRLATPVPHNAALDTARLRAARARAAAVPAGAGGAAPRPARRRPVVWSGHTNPEDTGTHRLLQTVRAGTAGPSGAVPAPGVPATGAGHAAATTQTLPRVDEPASPLVVGPRDPEPAETTQPLLTGLRPARGAYDLDTGEPVRTAGPGEPPAGRAPHGPYGTGRAGGTGGRPYGAAGPDTATGPDDGPDTRETVRIVRRGADPVRHAYYPGRRMNLGVVLLPLRVFLGFISIYAGMGKLCDPVYFDGGERGSMVTWLRSLEPWTIAAPLHEFALAHPVGAGLTVAFLQVIVGVLTMCGLWQRLAAGLGALLSAALLVTVSWRTVPAYDAPDIVYLAAWSPLIIAGAPVYSMDARLAGEAWRRLGPRTDIWDLRRRVLRRGTTLAAVVTGLALLVGALLGGAVRSSRTVTVPEPGEPPTNHLPGSPLPGEPGGRETRSTQGPGSRAPEAGNSPGPSASSSGTPSGRTSGTGSSPSQRQTVRAPQPTAPPAAEAPETAPSAGATGTPGGTASGSATTGASGGSTSRESGSSGGSSETSGSSGGEEGGSSGGALGGLLG